MRGKALFACALALALSLTSVQVAQAHGPTEEIMREVGLSRVRTWKQRIPEEYSIYQGLF